MKILKMLSLSAVCLLAFSQVSRADTTDLTGNWRVLLENSYHRKYIWFQIEEKDNRLRGKMTSKEYGTQDLDGRREADGKVFFWSTFYQRNGASTDTSFKGAIEGEMMVGKGRFFDKPYTFQAERSEEKDK